MRYPWQDEITMSRPHLMFVLLLIATICLVIHPCSASTTTELHIVKYANDKTTVLAEKTLTYQEMRDTLPVQGDGSTHYFHQGPVFVDDPNEVVEQELRWNPDEDTNVMEKDMGAVMGTSVKDLCDLVGGMSAGDTLEIKASDGMTKEFAYKNVYSPPARQGDMVITWYCSDSTFSTCTGPYPDSGYSDGMRLVFFADTQVNPWGAHVFGNFDWHESADKKYWYYYQGDAGERYPTTTGLSIKYVSEIRIYSTTPPDLTTSPSFSYGGRTGEGLPVPGSVPPVDPDLYGYKGKRVSTVKTGIINGSVRFFSDPDAGPILVSNRIRDFTLPLDVPPGSNITLARMYLYISDSQYIQGGKGIIPSFSTRLNTTFLEPDKMYIDTDGDDNGNGQVVATCAYDVRELLKGNGTYTFSIWNMDQDQSLFTIDKVLLVTAYETENATATSYWIDEGCDVILSQPEKGLFPENTETRYSFSGAVNMSTARDAYLYLVSTGLDTNKTTEHTVSFNKGTWYNIFDNESVFDNQSVFENNRTSSVMHLQVRAYLNETGNEATVQSSIRTQDADYLVNRNAFLIVEHDEPNSSAINTTTSGDVPRASSAGAPYASPLTNESRCCQVTLDSDPEGALIYVDGTYIGKITPYTLDVQKGDTHIVRFELDGYSPSVIQCIAMNSTNIRESLYTPVHSTKNRLIEEPEDPDGTRYGGLFIHSRPHSATISINGISTGKVAPAMFMGLEPGSYTIHLGKLQDITIMGEDGVFDFPDQTVWVQPDVITPVDISGIGNHMYSDIITDSHRYRGMPFTVNGYVNNKTIPARINTPLFDSFVTIHENESFVSYRIPIAYVWDEDRYLLFEPRDHQNLSITVTSSPRGAEVFIDGFRTGHTTPYTVGNLSEGPHRIMVTKNGYLPKESPVDLPRRTLPISMTYVDFYLEEYPSGFLYVNSIPKGGRVSIDNMYTGEVTPALFKTVPTGTHLVEVKGTNSTKTFYDVTINSLYMTNLTADFTPDDDD
jgi:hypothetical protein